MDAKGAPTGESEPACFPCGDVAKRIRPECTIAQMVTWFKNPAQAKKVDASFVDEFNGAKTVYNSLSESLPGMMFNPSCEVSKGTVYGCRVKQVFGLLTEGELASMLDEARFPLS